MSERQPLRKKYLNQAVVLADSFDKRFAPITLDIPRALMPLNNVPLIDYTIEFLASSGIERIFVVCVSHAQLVQDYLAQSQWSRAPGLEVRTIASPASKTLGDAMRRIHAENVIESDFLLVCGDVVGKLDLDELLYQHRLRKERDATTLMTSVYKRATPTHASRSLEDDTIIGLNAQGEVLFWENDPQAGTVEIDPLLILQEAEGSLRLHYDLLDTHIDVCSVEVLQLFLENFDYQSMRPDFVLGLLGQDIVKYKLFAHLVHNEYAARVKDLRTYASVSRDVIHRWSAPVVIENPLLAPESCYRLTRGLVYRERGVRTDPSSVVGPYTVIGGGTEIGANTIVAKTVVGRDCRIGANCTITNSFLWPGTVIGDGCTVDWSILCSDVHLYEATTIAKGCVLSFGVCVGPNVVLEAHTRLTREHVSAGDLGLAGGEEVTRSIKLGAKGVGVQWLPHDEAESNSLLASGRTAAAAVARAAQLLVDDSDADEESRSEEPPSETEDSEMMAGAVPGTFLTDFEVEVREIVSEGIRMGSSVDNIALEVNGRKFAHDKTFLECGRCVLWCIMAAAPESEHSGAPLLAEFKKLMSQWHDLLSKFVQEDDQGEILWTLQEYCERESPHHRYESIFGNLMYTLYETDVVDEDACLQWAKEQEELTSDDDRRFLSHAEKFLQWLQQESEEESE